MLQAISHVKRLLLPTTLLGLALLPAGTGRAQELPDWIEIDYASLLDRRQLTHSGEPVGAILEQLAGRGVPPAGQPSPDRQLHGLLEPLLEPYAFVLSDTLDLLAGVPERPWVEVGSLWQPGEAQPAWVELLRSRRYVVESDGHGRMRLCLPAVETQSSRPASAAAAEAAWSAARPILRHVVAAERRRLVRDLGRKVDAATIELEVHAYLHRPARSLFLLGTEAFHPQLATTGPAGLHAPVDLAGWQAFLDEGLLLEGARIDDEGRVRLLGSKPDRPITLLGRPLELADLAVAYRAVFHGGLAEPYMSLDRGFSPQTLIVNYGGRLRDTSLGWVSLLCDIRFKTFSLGLDIVRGTDERARLRAALPDFKSHMEHFAFHPDSGGVLSQQTRFWFYPDRVDLTMSGQGDVLVLRRVRMSAASERMQDEAMTAGGGEIPPWTQATIDAIDRDYERLATFFPELTDLDHVVRLLSLFTWLRQAGAMGQPLPELEALLALELPELPTPRKFPLLLAFNALPEAGTETDAVVYDRVRVAEALDRLDPLDGRPLPARRRLQRALAALDRNDPQSRQLLEEYARYPMDELSDTELDLLSFRAERLRMHITVLSTLDTGRAQPLTERQSRGEQLRVFSVGIGGLDLGMGQALARAESRSFGLSGFGSPDAPTALRQSAPSTPRIPAAAAPRAEWQADAPGVPQSVLPRHGLVGEPGVGRFTFGDNWIDIAVRRTPDSESASLLVETVIGGDSPDVRSRRVLLDDERRPREFERWDESRWYRYTYERQGSLLRTRRLSSPAGTVTNPDPRTLPAGLATLGIGAAAPGPSESPRITLRLSATPGGTPRNLEADFPRQLLQRAVQGPDVDLTPGRPLPGLAPLPPNLGAVETLMVLLNDTQRRAPWSGSRPIVAGEEDPLGVARLLRTWWARQSIAGQVVVGVDPTVSPLRWNAAPTVGGEALLILPADGFAGPPGRFESALRQRWSAGPVVSELPETFAGQLVLLVSAESPGGFGERLHELARQPAMRGKLLAAWCLAGPVRPDLPAAILAGGNVAGLGVATSSVVDLRTVTEELLSFNDALSRSTSERPRVERLPGPFLWYF